MTLTTRGHGSTHCKLIGLRIRGVMEGVTMTTSEQDALDVLSDILESRTFEIVMALNRLTEAVHGVADAIMLAEQAKTENKPQ